MAIIEETKDNFKKAIKIKYLYTWSLIIILRVIRSYDHHKIKSESYEKIIRNSSQSLKI